MNATLPAWELATNPTEFERTFHELVRAWKEKSGILSLTTQMAVIPEYQRIIGMGPAVLPLLLEELRRKPDWWFWALRAITGENPAPPEAAGKLKEITAAWIAWGQQHGLIQ